MKTTKGASKTVSRTSSLEVPSITQDTRKIVGVLRRPSAGLLKLRFRKHQLELLYKATSYLHLRSSSGKKTKTCLVVICSLGEMSKYSYAHGS